MHCLLPFPEKAFGNSSFSSIHTSIYINESSEPANPSDQGQLRALTKRGLFMAATFATFPMMLPVPEKTRWTFLRTVRTPEMFLKFFSNTYSCPAQILRAWQNESTFGKVTWSGHYVNATMRPRFASALWRTNEKPKRTAIVAAAGLLTQRKSLSARQTDGRAESARNAVTLDTCAAGPVMPRISSTLIWYRRPKPWWH